VRRQDRLNKHFVAVMSLVVSHTCLKIILTYVYTSHFHFASFSLFLDRRFVPDSFIPYFGLEVGSLSENSRWDLLGTCSNFPFISALCALIHFRFIKSNNTDTINSYFPHQLFSSCRRYVACCSIRISFLAMSILTCWILSFNLS
jgi:hypothetical protein